MRRLIVSTLMLTLLLALPEIASAQRRAPAPSRERVPAAGTVAAGIDVGVLLPTNDGLSNSALINVLYEYYMHPRVSVRTEFGWSNPAFGGGAIDSLRQMPLRFDVNYNWEGGRVHPFVGTGVGIYFLQFRTGGTSVGDTEQRLGLNTGGGFEYFLNRSVTFKTEGRYHAVANARGQDPSGVALTVGLKTYF
ncbi:MAG TPA: outer membrane beta-barrel protein [Vicinamibacterales bacterium]|nr:outer membrane beta-barrel protein [Vicinamibacterales bacterium]